MVIPELIRLMVERGLEMDDAIEAVTRACAYTNHTILAEALEKWPISYLKKAVPQLIPIIEVLDDKVRRMMMVQFTLSIEKKEYTWLTLTFIIHQVLMAWRHFIQIFLRM